MGAGRGRYTLRIYYTVRYEVSYTPNTIHLFIFLYKLFFFQDATLFDTSERVHFSYIY